MILKFIYIFLLLFNTSIPAKEILGQEGDSLVSEIVRGGLMIEKSNLEFLQSERDSYLFPSQSILSTRITIELNEGTIKDILSYISLKTGIKMIYSDDLVKDKVSNFYQYDQTIENILNFLFSNKDVSYILTEKNELIIAKTKKIDEETGSIQGTVRDKSGEPLIGANVIIKENKFGSATNRYGRYSIHKLKPGKYTIEASYIGYKKETKEVIVKKGEIITVDFYLESTAFYIGAIEVVGTTELIPKDANTKTIISGAEVEHFQASSIKDVPIKFPNL